MANEKSTTDQGVREGKAAVEAAEPIRNSDGTPIGIDPKTGTTNFGGVLDIGKDDEPEREKPED